MIRVYIVNLCAVFSFYSELYSEHITFRVALRIF